MKSLSKQKTLTISVFIITVVTLVSAAVYVADAAQTGNLYVYLTLGNANPTITWVNGSVSVNPVIGGTRTVHIQFNVTDTNGASDLNDATATIVLNKTGEITRTSSSCTAAGNAGSTETYDCSIDMEYYDLDGQWTINATIQDNAGASSENLSFTFSYGTLKAIQLGNSLLNFSNAQLGQTSAAVQNPVQIDNLGNQDLAEVNVTAYTLEKGAETIDANRFTVNVSDSIGDTLSNGVPVIVTDGLVSRDNGGTDSNETLYFYVNMPSAGLTEGTFNATSQWIVGVN